MTARKNSRQVFCRQCAADGKSTECLIEETRAATYCSKHLYLASVTTVYSGPRRPSYAAPVVPVIAVPADAPSLSDAQLDHAWALGRFASAAALRESAHDAYLAATPTAAAWEADRATAAAAYAQARLQREAMLATFVGAVGAERAAVDAAFADATADANRDYTIVKAALTRRRDRRLSRNEDEGRALLWAANQEANVGYRDAQHEVRVARGVLFVAEANDQDAARAVLAAQEVLRANPTPSNEGDRAARTRTAREELRDRPAFMGGRSPVDHARYVLAAQGESRGLLAAHARAKDALDDACDAYNETADPETHLGERGVWVRRLRLRGEPPA